MAGSNALFREIHRHYSDTEYPRSEMYVRGFVYSCLVNLSHGMDTSGVFGLLSSEARCAYLARILTSPMSVDAGRTGKVFSFQYVVLYTTDRCLDSRGYLPVRYGNFFQPSVLYGIRPSENIPGSWRPALHGPVHRKRLLVG